VNDRHPSSISELSQYMATRSILFESIQQSPIDPLFENLSGEIHDACPSDLCLLVAGDEEKPKSPPRETPLVRNNPKFRNIDSRPWLHQIGSGLQVDSTRITGGSDGWLYIAKNLERLRISPNGCHIEYRDQIFLVNNRKLPPVVAELLSETYSIISDWRSRVVRLSMDTDDMECSLMDDLFPPRTFLVEFKNRTALRSLKIQNSVSYWGTVAGRTIQVPVVDIENSSNKSHYIHRLAPELSMLDPEKIWCEMIQLRAMCFEEDRRLSSGKSPNQSLSQCQISGG
jgi:hypothetical protein